MGSSSTTTQNNKPYAAAQPGIDFGLGQADALFKAGGFQNNPYPGQLVAGYDQFEQQADAMAPQAASGGYGAAQQAQGYLGNMMDPNYQSAQLDQVRSNVIDRIMPQINQTFAMQGRTGGGLHQQTLAEGLARGLGEVEYGAQQANMSRGMQAAGMVPSINAAGYGAADWLRGAGQQRRGYDQSQIAADALKYDQTQSAEADALQRYLALTTGAGSMFGVQTAKTQQNPGLLQILGTGLQGYAMGSTGGLW